MVDVNSWGGKSVSLSENLLYMSWSNTTQLAIFDTSDKDTIPPPALISSAGGSNARPLLNGNYLITGSGSGLKIFDIFDPNNPVAI